MKPSKVLKYLYIYIYLVYIYLYIKFKNSDTHARRFEDAHETETLPTLKLIPFWRRVGGMITKSFDVELDCLWKTSAFETFAGLSHFETSAFTFGLCHLFLPPWHHDPLEVSLLHSRFWERNAINERSQQLRGEHYVSHKLQVPFVTGLLPLFP